MHRLAALFVVTLAACGIAASQAPPALSSAEMKARAAEAEMHRQELVNLEQETARAIQLGNMAFFRRVYSDDFIGTASYGQVLDKASYLRSIETSTAKYASFIATDIHVRLYEETAVVTCMWTMRGTASGKSFNRQSRVIHLYVNGTRGWQAVASQETPLPGGER